MYACLRGSEVLIQTDRLLRDGADEVHKFFSKLYKDKQIFHPKFLKYISKLCFFSFKVPQQVDFTDSIEGIRIFKKIMYVIHS